MRVSWSLDNQVTTTSVESSYPHHGPKAYKTDSYAFRSVDVSAVVSEAPAFPRLGCGLKRKGVWKALCGAGWGTTAGHFFHVRHSSFRACCLLEMQIKQNRVPVCSSWAFPDLGGGGGGLGVCESVLEFMGSIFCKSQREQGWEAYCADKRFLLSTQELLTAQIVPVEFKGERGSSGRPTWACLFIFRVSMAPRCPSSGGGQNSSPIPTPASSP